MRKLFLLNAPLAIVVLASDCTEPSSKTPASPTGPDVISITIDGPSSIPPGQSAQFAATMRLTDGTTKAAVTPSVTWRSSNGNVMTVGVDGVVTARTSAGDAILTADVVRLTPNSVRTAAREIVILPDGTFRVVGQVVDAEFLAVPVAGARVQVTPGTLSTTTDSTGRYKLYGVPPAAEIRITADGYVTQSDNVQLTTNTTRNYQLALLGSRLNFTGNYRLAVDVSGACSGSPQLSSDLQHRRYDAFVIQTGPTLDVTLTEPIFSVTSNKGNRFTGQVGPTGAIFTLDAYSSYYYPYYRYYYLLSYPSVAERLSNGTYLVVDGRAVMTASDRSLVGTLSGGISNYDSKFPTSGHYLGHCSGALQFSLTPR